MAVGGVSGISRTPTTPVSRRASMSPTLQKLLGGAYGASSNAAFPTRQSSTLTNLLNRATTNSTSNAAFPTRSTVTSRSGPSVPGTSTAAKALAIQANPRTGGTASVPGASPVADKLAAQTLANSTAASTGGATSQATTAFGKSFTPDSAEMMRNNPDALIAAYFKHRGLGANTGLQAMSQEQNGDRLRLLHMLFGSRDPNKVGQIGDYLDYSQGMLGQAMTPGAKYYGAQDVLNKLYTKDVKDPIFQRLYGAELTPADQSGRFVDAYATANSATMDPWMLDAQISRLTQLENEWIAASAQGKTGTMNWADYVKKNGF